MFVDLFYNFKRSMKREATLRDYMAFTNAEIQKVFKDVAICWLS